MMRILVVEDQSKVAQFIVNGLQEEGYSVDCVSRGDEVESTLARERYDLVVLDVLLPGKNGIDVARDLREHGNRIPILMLTAQDQLKDRVQGLDAGADDYLVKPFAFEELLARIRALLRRAQMPTGGSLSLADLCLEPIARKVTRAGQKIELTAKEYALLEFLLRNKNRVLSRSELLSRVWGIHHDPNTNVVDVLIRYLRAKIDDPHPQHLIHTVRGTGYVLKDEE